MSNISFNTAAVNDPVIKKLLADQAQTGKKDNIVNASAALTRDDLAGAIEAIDKGRKDIYIAVAGQAGPQIHKLDLSNPATVKNMLNDLMKRIEEPGFKLSSIELISGKEASFDNTLGTDDINPAYAKIIEGSPIAKKEYNYRLLSQISYDEKSGTVSSSQVIRDNSAKSPDELKKGIKNFTAVETSLTGTFKSPEMYKEGLVYLKSIAERNNGVLPEKVVKGITNNQEIPERLLVSALHDIAEKKDISQGYTNTCNSACIQIITASKEPDKYLDMLNTLTKKNGDYNGITINNTFWKEIKSGGGMSMVTGRNLSAMLFQNSVTDVFNGARGFDSTDENASGLPVKESARALNTIMNTDKYKALELGDFSPAELLKNLELSKPSENNPVLTALKYSSQGIHSNHAVTVIAIDQNVTFINPQGKTESISKTEFQNRILGLVSDSDSLAGKDKLPDEYLKVKNNPEALAALIDSKGEALLSKLPVKEKVHILNTLTRNNAPVPAEFEQAKYDPAKALEIINSDKGEKFIQSLNLVQASELYSSLLGNYAACDKIALNLKGGSEKTHAAANKVLAEMLDLNGSKKLSEGQQTANFINFINEFANEFKAEEGMEGGVLNTMLKLTDKPGVITGPVIEIFKKCSY